MNDRNGTGIEEKFGMRSEIAKRKKNKLSTREKGRVFEKDIIKITNWFLLVLSTERERC